MLSFSDDEIAQMFGTEAAEDEPEDRFRQYFISNKAYENLIADLPLRILVGHKGVGKSALLTRARMRDLDENKLAIWVKPGDVESIFRRNDSTVEHFTALVEYWKEGLPKIITRHFSTKKQIKF